VVVVLTAAEWRTLNVLSGRCVVVVLLSRLSPLSPLSSPDPLPEPAELCDFLGGFAGLVTVCVCVSPPAVAAGTPPVGPTTGTARATPSGARMAAVMATAR
jgi:hypothetical protein